MGVRQLHQSSGWQDARCILGRLLSLHRPGNIRRCIWFWSTVCHCLLFCYCGSKITGKEIDNGSQITSIDLGQITVTMTLRRPRVTTASALRPISTPERPLEKMGHWLHVAFVLAAPCNALRSCIITIVVIIVISAVILINDLNSCMSSLAQLEGRLAEKMTHRHGNVFWSSWSQCTTIMLASRCPWVYTVKRLLRSSSS